MSLSNEGTYAFGSLAKYFRMYKMNYSDYLMYEIRILNAMKTSVAVRIAY